MPDIIKDLSKRMFIAALFKIVEVTYQMWKIGKWEKWILYWHYGIKIGCCRILNGNKHSQLQSQLR